MEDVEQRSDVEVQAEASEAGALAVLVRENDVAQVLPVRTDDGPAPKPVAAYGPQDEQFRLLVDAAIDRDPVATQRVVESIRPIVLRYCRARIGRLDRSFAVADDVVLEVCLSVISALPSYRDQEQSFLAFVYGIARHKVAEAHRAAAHNRSLLVPEVPDPPETVAGPEQRVLQDELKGSMDRLLAVLSDKQREIVVLRVVVGLSPQETADLVGSTPGAVRLTEHRALRRLRKLVSIKEF
ncbi:RNA polymerase sigma factor ShbA [Kutzneria buriramensis]|nr:RNA polymerase sigma factor ShbA [Kutzneria buriramensis]